jgi:hypothetical protein
VSKQTVSPRSLTRQQVRDLEANIRLNQDEAFEAMPDADMQTMTDAIDEIGATYTQAVDDAADEARHEACLELETIIEKYGYDVVKSYVCDCGNTDPDTELNLNDEIELL